MSAPSSTAFILSGQSEARSAKQPDRRGFDSEPSSGKLSARVLIPARNEAATIGRRFVPGRNQYPRGQLPGGWFGIEPPPVGLFCAPGFRLPREYKRG